MESNTLPIFPVTSTLFRSFFHISRIHGSNPLKYYKNEPCHSLVFIALPTLCCRRYVHLSKGKGVHFYILILKLKTQKMFAGLIQAHELVEPIGVHRHDTILVILSKRL